MKFPIHPVTLDLVMHSWHPEDHPVHCSNCSHARVFGDPDDPQVRCTEGHGAPRSIVKLLRSKNASSFKVARNCPDFESMDDE